VVLFKCLAHFFGGVLERLLPIGRKTLLAMGGVARQRVIRRATVRALGCPGRFKLFQFICAAQFGDVLGYRLFALLIRLVRR
jgi:hypothetical protein